MRGCRGVAWYGCDEGKGEGEGREEEEMGG